MRISLGRSLAATALAGLAVVSAPPALAGADSIAFIRQGDIWIANTDGSDARRLTTDGAGNDPYKSLSAAKGAGGTLLGTAQGIQNVAVLGADGAAKREIVTQRYTSPGTSADLNPSGSKIVYVESNTATSYVNDVADPAREGYHNTSATSFTTWLDEERLVVAESYESTEPSPGTVGCAQDGSVFLAITAPKYPDSPEPSKTFVCRNGTDLSQPATSGDGRFLVSSAAATGAPAGDSRILRLDPNAPSGLQEGTFLTPVGFTAIDPDISPDGTQVVFSGPGNAVYTVPIGGGEPKKILDDASDPAWTPYGAANGGPGTTTSPGGTTTSPGGTTTQPGATDPGSGTGQPAGEAGLKLTLKKGIRLRPSLTNGVNLTGRTEAPGTISATLRVDRKTAKRYRLSQRTVARGRETVSSAGAFTVELKFTKQARRRLKRARRVTFTARFAQQGGPAKTGKVTFRR